MGGGVGEDVMDEWKSNLPEYWKVAPNIESIADPRTPPRAPITMRGHWGGLSLSLSLLEHTMSVQ